MGDLIAWYKEDLPSISYESRGHLLRATCPADGTMVTYAFELECWRCDTCSKRFDFNHRAANYYDLQTETVRRYSINEWVALWWDLPAGEVTVCLGESE